MGTIGAEGFEPPKYLAGLIAAINDAAKAAQAGLLVYLLVGLYLLATAFSSSDEDILLGKAVTISQIGASLPVSFSFAIAPFVFVFLHSYTLTRYDMLATNARYFLGELRATVPLETDRERCRQLLANVEFVQTITAARGSSLRSRFWPLLTIATMAVFPVVVLLLVQINALRYQSDLITWVQRLWLLLDMLAIFVFFIRNPLNGRALGSETLFGFAIHWAALFWLPPLIVWLNLTWLNVVPAEAIVADVRYERPSVSWADAIDQPLDRVLCPRLKWGCRYLRVEHRTLLDHVWDNKAMAVLHGDTGDFAEAIAGIEGVVLRGRKLRFAVLDDSRLYAADLIGADLRHASLRGARLQSAKLSTEETRLDGADLSDAQMTGAKLIGTRMAGAILIGAHLAGADLTDAKMIGANLMAAHLVGAVLSGARLAGAILKSADLEGAHLRRVSLTGANLDDARLDGADLTSAQLVSASLRRAQLSGAELDGANLAATALNSAQMMGADLSTAQLAGADLGGETFSAGLFNFRLSGANLAGAQLESASAWQVGSDKSTNLELTDLRYVDFRTPPTQEDRANWAAAIDEIPESAAKDAAILRLRSALATHAFEPNLEFTATPDRRVLVSAPTDDVLGSIPPDWLLPEPKTTDGWVPTDASRTYIDALADFLFGDLSQRNKMIARGITHRVIRSIQPSAAVPLSPLRDPTDLFARVTGCHLVDYVKATRFDVDPADAKALKNRLQAANVGCEALLKAVDAAAAPPK